ncbi:MAG: dUTP diphosphatase [Bacilli bacterium]
MRRFEWLPEIDHAGLDLPARQTAGAAGYDLCACEDMEIAPDSIALVGTGLRIMLPDGEFLAIYARSSLAVKRRLMLANSVGVIDADYFGNPGNGGHIMIPLWNFGLHPATVLRGERIAQGIIMNAGKADDDGATLCSRQGGFGSTGT